MSGVLRLKSNSPLDRFQALYDACVDELEQIEETRKLEELDAREDEYRAAAEDSDEEPIKPSKMTLDEQGSKSWRAFMDNVYGMEHALGADVTTAIREKHGVKMPHRLESMSDLRTYADALHQRGWGLI